MANTPTKPTRMTIAASYTLYNIIIDLIYERTPEGLKERNIPFNIKYKLLRSKDMLEKDVVYFESERNKLIKEYGVEDSEGNTKIDPSKSKDFESALEKVLKIEVEHNLSKLKPEDLDMFNINISATNLDLFIMAMVDDPEFVEDIMKPIETSKTEEQSSDNQPTPEN